MNYAEKYNIYINRVEEQECEQTARLLACNLTKVEATDYITAEEKLWGEEFDIWMERS